MLDSILRCVTNKNNNCHILSDKDDRTCVYQFSNAFSKKPSLAFSKILLQILLLLLLNALETSTIMPKLMTVDRKLKDIARSADRYSLFKVGPVISASHGIGSASMSLLIHEVRHFCLR